MPDRRNPIFRQFIHKVASNSQIAKLSSTNAEK
ncbi:unknown [[Mannheimia] succiniciproducens MBEL55E]|uniref:Uncharacterized protein n=1 Tax=Mannheimia succiniciproducens (strain KCTC 0769BP / MBEL55E) TaxID=221988 RepID=Q65RI8_MANSM|nr:unknown [[Mannheimia] succiniciproducens MBEL55E]